MPPHQDHKKPAAAFALLCVIALAVVGNGVRAKASELVLAVTGPAVLRLPVISGQVHLPATPEQRPDPVERPGAPGREPDRAAVPDRGERAGRHPREGREDPADRTAGGRWAGPDGPDTLPQLLSRGSWRHPAHAHRHHLRELRDLRDGWQVLRRDFRPAPGRHRR